MILNAAASVFLGSVLLSGVDVADCAGQGTQDAECTSTQVIYGVMLLIGAPIVGLFAAANALLVSFAMPAPRANDEVEGWLRGE